ncbi:Nn.00g081210.m01.CDS01 [Neocucurbitaria sp. VM-36]
MAMSQTCYVHPSLFRAMCHAESPSNNPTMSNIITIEQEIQVLEEECHAIRTQSFRVMEREAEPRHKISEIKKGLDELGQNGSEDPKAA